MLTTYNNLHLSVLLPQDREKRMNYKYIITTGYAQADRAFRSDKGLLHWLNISGLSIPGLIASTDEDGEQTVNLADGSHHQIEGEYKTMMHLTEFPPEYIFQSGWTSCRWLSNASYTEGRITTDDNGVRTVHFLNPNADRIIYDYFETSDLIGW